LCVLLFSRAVVRMLFWEILDHRATRREEAHPFAVPLVLPGLELIVAPELGRDEHVCIPAPGVAPRDIERLFPGVYVIVEPRDVRGGVALEVRVAIWNGAASGGVVCAPVLRWKSAQVVVECAGVAEDNVHVAVAVDVRIVLVGALKDKTSVCASGYGAPVSSRLPRMRL